MIKDFNTTVDKHILSKPNLLRISMTKFEEITEENINYLKDNSYNIIRVYSSNDKIYLLFRRT